MESLQRMDWLAFVGRSFLGVLSWLGQIAALMGELMIGLKSGRWRLKLVAQQIMAIGYGSQLVVVVTGGLHRRGVCLSVVCEVQGVRH